MQKMEKVEAKKTLEGSLKVPGWFGTRSSIEREKREEGQRLKFRILSGNEERQTFESPMVSLDIAQRLQIEKDSSEVWDAFLKLRKVKSLSLGPKKEVLESLKAGFLVKN